MTPFKCAHEIVSLLIESTIASDLGSGIPLPDARLNKFRQRLAQEPWLLGHLGRWRYDLGGGHSDALEGIVASIVSPPKQFHPVMSPPRKQFHLVTIGFLHILRELIETKT